MDFWIQFAISMAINIAQSVVKNADSRAKMRRVLTKLRDALIVAYPVEEFAFGSSKLPDSAFEAKP